MRNSLKTLIGFCVLGVVLSVSNFNCSDSRQVNFSTTPVKENLASQAAAGGGDGFDGKPLPGDYVRTFPNYQCDKSEVGTQGLMKASHEATVISDNCHTTNYSFLYESQILEFNAYNLDYVGVGAATYERVGSAVKEELPIVDVWCQFSTESSGIDFVVKSTNDLTRSQAKIYLGQRPDLSGPWYRRFVSPLSVNRRENANTVSFEATGVSIEVQKSSRSDVLATGVASATIDGTTYSTSHLNCRVTSARPIEDMGTQVTQQSTLNFFTTDSQEQVCDQPGVLACENLEAKPVTTSPGTFPPNYKSNYLAFSQPNNAIVGSGNNLDGQKSLEWRFGPNMVGAGGGDFDFAFTSEAYVRFYMKFSSNFVFSNLETKLLAVSGSSWSVGFVLDPQKRPFLRIGTSTQTLPLLNSSFPLAVPDQWMCVEMRASAGLAELWVDGNKVISQSNLAFSDQFNRLNQWLRWECSSGNQDPSTGHCQNTSDPLNTHPQQSIYFDNFVVGRQRIGCY